MKDRHLRHIKPQPKAESAGSESGFAFSRVGMRGTLAALRLRELRGPPGPSRADEVLRRFSWEEQAGPEATVRRGR